MYIDKSQYLLKATNFFLRLEIFWLEWSSSCHAFFLTSVNQPDSKNLLNSGMCWNDSWKLGMGIYLPCAPVMAFIIGFSIVKTLRSLHARGNCNSRLLAAIKASHWSIIRICIFVAHERQDHAWLTVSLEICVYWNLLCSFCKIFEWWSLWSHWWAGVTRKIWCIWLGSFLEGNIQNFRLLLACLIFLLRRLNNFIHFTE